MAGERTFTEGEAYALVADAVERETAAAKTQAAESEAKVVTLENEKDALELRVTAAEEAKATAEQALEDYKAEQEREKAAEAKRDERITKVTEIAPQLITDDEKGRARADRIVAMADEDFDEYVATLTDVAPQKAADDGKGGKTTATRTTTDATTGVPRESAAFKGGNGGGDSTKPSVGGVFSARRAAMAAAKVG